MRKALDGLYSAGLWFSALAMITIGVLVLCQVIGRVLDRTLIFFGGDALGLAVPSLAEFGGFLFVASAFLAFPATFRTGGHVRVTLLSTALSEGLLTRALQVLVLTAAVALAGFATWHSGLQAFDSYTFGTPSYGTIPVPLWLPQTAMTLGLLIFLVSLLDDLVAVLMGQTPAYRLSELSRAEQGE